MTFLTIPQVARALGIDAKTARRLVADREIGVHRITGRLLRVSEEDLKAYVASKRIPPRGEVNHRQRWISCEPIK
jgi:excisionase family DNA binding protein